MDQNGPEWARMDQNGPEWASAQCLRGVVGLSPPYCKRDPLSWVRTKTEKEGQKTQAGLDVLLSRDPGLKEIDKTSF